MNQPSNSVRRSARKAARTVLRQLPPPARLRVREVKRAALGQPPARKPAAAPKPKAKPARAPAPPRLTHPQRSVPGTTRLELRRENIFATADRAGLALEIGPAHNGILPKRDGFNTRTTDYLDRDGLVAKYQHFEQYSMDDIEDVDYVLAPGAVFSEAIPDRFDLVLASHVLEHTTSLIDFVNECGKLLRPGGVLSLVVPDHRFCFDRFRERSSLGSIIDASLDPKPVHTVGTLTEFSMLASKHRGSTSWTPGHAGKYSLVHTMDAVRANAAKATTGTYVDVHHWIFSPNHLRLLLNDLADLGYITLREAHFHDTVGHEFFLNLTAESAGPGLTRQELIDRADEELRTLDQPVWEPAETG